MMHKNGHLWIIMGKTSTVLIHYMQYRLINISYAELASVPFFILVLMSIFQTFIDKYFMENKKEYNTSNKTLYNLTFSQLWIFMSNTSVVSWIMYLYTILHELFLFHKASAATIHHFVMVSWIIHLYTILHGY